MLFASAVPVSAGVASSVLSPLVSSPVISPTSSVTDVITGAIGAMVSTLSSKALLGSEVLPAGSVAVTVRLWLPSSSGSAGVKLQLPLPSASTEPSTVSPSRMVTVLFASAVPVSAGVVSSV
ncbi:hypothetical protein RM465_09140, partial [Halomonas sp. PAR7]